MDSAAKENRQSLYEWDTKRGDRPPRDVLPRNLVPRPGREKETPLYHYGFPFTARYAINYARRHHLTVEVDEEDREFFRGYTVLDFADIDDEWLESDSDLKRIATCISRTLMLGELSRRCRFALRMGRPFSDDWDGIVSLWTNANFDERFDECHDHEEVIEVLKDAMNETKGHNSLKPQWWFDWNNDVGIFE
ncbi:hypothetical protein GSI_10284 [Ganoderma sinense ZZ0214-1]|uniref:Uncharacterized protein n=1 Tax=Ganoderma sinense ZZ0214-1 TaxID=1077348 RepID=A0A2G8S042_9APHY|nr:hypothetical protein GSI_10284 [Ganoderma sinense ZZ0214-1]